MMIAKIEIIDGRLLLSKGQRERERPDVPEASSAGRGSKHKTYYVR